MYHKIKKGIQKKSSVLTEVRIERLEQIGFLWCVSGPVVVFNKRCLELIAFRDKFGHCNPQNYKANPSFENWCNVIRRAYINIQKGITNHCYRALFTSGDYDMIFENRCQELIAFKNEFGHCNVPVKYASNQSLGNWCTNMRATHSRIQKGLPTKSFLPAERIAQLDYIGFTWRSSFRADSLEKRCR